MKKPYEITAELAQFNGTACYHSILPGYVITDGVKAMGELCGALWLVMLIISHQKGTKIPDRNFQAWKLTVNDNKGVVSVSDGNDTRVLVQNVEYTDFPLPEMILWAQPSGDNLVIFLPSEY